MQFDNNHSFRKFVDVKNGTVDRIIFSDEDIFRREQEQIFARAWNFMCHESQIPKPGDFFVSYIGQESVIATRDRKGDLQVFLNSCRHRGNAVCRAEKGNTRAFLCTYHGWTYDLEGKLIGVPGNRDLYQNGLDKSKWGLIKAGKVASYKGFVFANMDPDAPDLEQYLGKVARLGLDLIASRGNVVAVEGVQKNIIGCNWKLAVDNLFDWYHVNISHASAARSGYLRPPAPPSGSEPLPSLMSGDHRVLLGEYGHAISGPRLTEELWELVDRFGEHEPMLDQAWRNSQSARAALGTTGRDTNGHTNVFPNLWITTNMQICLRIPKSALETELWWFTFIDADKPAETNALRITRSNHTFGPAGMLEQDDGENWDQSTRQTQGVIARRYPLNLSMNLGRGQIAEPEDGGAPYIDTNVNEHAQLWTYRSWADWMDAADWASLEQNKSPAPTGTV